MTYYAWRIECSVETPTSQEGRSYFRNEYLLALACDFDEAVGLVKERFADRPLRIHKVMKDRPFGEDVLLPQRMREALGEGQTP